MAESRELFSQNAPSQMFDRVLPVNEFILRKFTRNDFYLQVILKDFDKL